MSILLLCLLILISALIILFMKKFTNVKLTNLIFCITTFVLYATFVLVVGLQVGIHDWNFLNTLPVANVSPFMFGIAPLYFILPKKVKKYYLTLISLLSLGLVLGTSYNMITYTFRIHFALDYVAHFTLALWGVYLVKSNQVSLKPKQCVIGGSIIVAVALIMVLVNVIFDTSFFGLSLNGKHNIYGQVLVSSSYVSALIYFSGLLFILVAGYFAQKLLNLSKKDEKTSIDKAS